MYSSIKASIISQGGVNVSPKVIIEKKYQSLSSAGPDAEKITFFLKLGSTLLRTKHCASSSFALEKIKNQLFLINLKEEKKIPVEMVPVTGHCPNQIFVTIAPNCVYSCKFCRLGESNKKTRSFDEVKEIIEMCAKNGPFNCVSFTSGKTKNGKEIEITKKLIKWVKDKYDVFVGVEIYPESKRDILDFKNAGADEFKLNIEIYNKELFEKLCPEKDYNTIIDYLTFAVSLFGRGKVSTNMIFGIDDRIETLIQGVDFFAKKGIMANLRPLSFDPLIKESIEKIIKRNLDKKSKEEMIELANKQEIIWKKNNLWPIPSKTMCFGCRGCDLV